MQTLTRHPQPPAPEPGAPEAPASEAVVDPGQPAVAPAGDLLRQCGTCSASMAAAQDWCLECGTAAPGRLGRRPGWRAVGTTLALTGVLLGGAVAASYAALDSDAAREAVGAAPPAGTPVAMAPPAVAAPPAPVLPPKIVAPTVRAPVVPPVSTPAPVVTAEPAQPEPAATSPATPAPSTSSRPSTSTPRGSTDTGTTRTPVELTPLALGAGAAALYDPYGRATDPGDPALAQDGDQATAFTVGTPADGKDLQVGVVVDLGAVKQVRGVRLTTSTPGGVVEVYGADGSQLPPEIVDTRWEHPASRKAVTRSQQITLPGGGGGYRYVVLWFTAPPAGGSRVAVKELQILH